MRQTNPKEFIKFRADFVLRRAIKLRAALRDVGLQDVIVDVLREALSAEIEEVQRRGLVDGHPAAGDTKKRTRKHKEGNKEG
jgi:hypothetical protein